ncbi:unnamed protein product [Oikopleura dioica]|uniref:CUB domain-containing protein n=1 Tax=Oikopleura dioica TaxID=34765 RepID=E4XBL0_OIKDI|nr:unnamed protein product [Oikopleura dioica]
MLVILFFIENVLTDNCHVINGNHGEISSQHPYSGGEDWCIWVRSRCQTGLLLTAKKLKLTNCTSDMLTIFTKDESISLCKQHAILPLSQRHYSGGEFILEFKSGVTSSGYGFDVSWQCDEEKISQISAPISLERNLNFPKTFKTVVLNSFDQIIEENNNKIESVKRLSAIRSSFSRMSGDIERATSRKERDRKCVVTRRTILEDTLADIRSISTVNGLQEFLEKIWLFIKFINSKYLKLFNLIRHKKPMASNNEI